MKVVIANLVLYGSATALPQLLGGLLGGGAAPMVELDYGTFKGTKKFSGVNSFLGMPFAKAGRLQNARMLGGEDKLQGVQDATSYGPACPQQQLIASPISSDNGDIGGLLSAVEQLILPPIDGQDEDCLNINVQIPEGIDSTAGLPVFMWIHGGGYELGASAAVGSETTALPGLIYQGANIVTRSVEMKQPVVFVSANYRMNAFGTLASQEITDAGVSNLLLKDQRIAMQWVQKYISLFGGDPSKVTVMGESAGSMSIATHLLLDESEGLFRGAIMASGGIMKLKPYSHAQHVFDFIADKSGCGSASDKLACLRTTDYAKIYNAVQQLPNFLSYESTVVPWYPRPDGSFLPDSPHRLVRAGKARKVPIIIGAMKDEGTLFSVVPQLNITTDEDFQFYFRNVFFPHLSPDQIRAFTSLYSEDPREGSPFDTGYANAIGPQYKRLAAAIGDYTFDSGRRDLLEHVHATQPAYTYLIEQDLPLLGQLPLLNNLGLSSLPILGSFHISEVVLNAFGFLPPAISKNSLNIMSTWISFVNNLDPNEHGLADLPHWPTWGLEEKSMFKYNEAGCEIIRDDFRETQMRFINDNAETYIY
ncbi:putative carotenoid ester lipase precursor protein [Neofusicoccum parvum]|nr:putative carotenoid ester lipase precursor protein [Neofusicoccum parvum]